VDFSCPVKKAAGKIKVGVDRGILVWVLKESEDVLVIGERFLWSL
jgi:hypothetical protein